MSAVADVRKSWTSGDIAFVTVNSAVQSDVEVVAAATGRKIRVLAMHMSAISATNLLFESGGAADLTGTITLSATDLNVTWPYNPFGWFETAAGAALTRDSSAAVASTVTLSYVLI